MIRLLSLIIALVGFGGCAGKPPLREEVGRLSLKDRQLYLAYYPELTQEQRSTLLASDASPYLLLKFWELHEKFFGPEGEDGKPGPFLAKPANYTVTRLEIEAAAPENDYTKASEIEVRAYAVYADGRRPEVTGDVTWSVTPSFVSFAEGKLKLGCVHSDVTVSATFLHEGHAQKILSVRKPIERIELRIASSSQAATESGTVGFEAVAHCADGTRQVVSCQSNWSISGPGVDQGGCGKVLLKKEALARQRIPVKVSAEYGGKRAVHPFDLLGRRPAGGK